MNIDLDALGEICKKPFYDVLHYAIENKLNYPKLLAKVYKDACPNLVEPLSRIKGMLDFSPNDPVTLTITARNMALSFMENKPISMLRILEDDKENRVMAIGLVDFNRDSMSWALLFIRPGEIAVHDCAVKHYRSGTIDFFNVNSRNAFKEIDGAVQEIKESGIFDYMKERADNFFQMLNPDEIDKLVDRMMKESRV